MHVGRSPLLGRYNSIRISECLTPSPVVLQAEPRVVLWGLELHKAVLFIYPILAERGLQSELDILVPSGPSTPEILMRGGVKSFMNENV